MPAKPMLVNKVVEIFNPIPGSVKVEFGGTRIYEIRKRGDMPGYWAITSPRKCNGRFVDKIHLNEGVVLVVTEEKKDATVSTS